MRKLNILFPYTGDSVGGSHISSLMLAQSLRAAGHQVTLGLHRHKGALVDYLATQGETWLPLPDVTPPKLRAPWRTWAARRAVRRDLATVLARHRFDVVHSHDMRNHLIWNAACAGRVPHIWHQRTPASGRHMAVYGARAAAFIAVSQFTLSSLPAGLHPKARMIYNPFTADEPASETARARLCTALNVAPCTPVVAYVANFSDRKRPELFVEIAARVAAGAEGSVVFAMFGAMHEPFLTRVRARIAETGLEGQVHLMGQKTPFGAWMAGFSALVAPARQEALGRTLIEAGLAGVPVVATNEGGNPEIIEDGHSGWLVAPDDAAGFALAVSEVLGNADATAARCAAARARCQARFSLQAHVTQILDVYATVIGANPNGKAA